MDVLTVRGRLIAQHILNIYTRTLTTLPNEALYSLRTKVCGGFPTRQSQQLDLECLNSRDCILLPKPHCLKRMRSCRLRAPDPRRRTRWILTKASTTGNERREGGALIVLSKRERVMIQLENDLHRSCTDVFFAKDCCSQSDCVQTSDC